MTQEESNSPRLNQDYPPIYQIPLRDPARKVHDGHDGEGRLRQRTRPVRRQQQWLFSTH